MDEVSKRRCKKCSGEVDYHWVSDDLSQATFFVGRVLVGELAGQYATIDFCPTCALHGMVTALTFESTVDVAKKDPKKKIKIKAKKRK